MTTFREKSRPTKMLSRYARTGWSPERRFIQAVAIQRWRPWDALDRAQNPAAKPNPHRTATGRDFSSTKETKFKRISSHY